MCGTYGGKSLMKAQTNAIKLYFSEKLKARPDNTVGFTTMGALYLGCEPCRDPKEFWSTFDCLEFGGSLQLPYRFVFANYCLQSSSLLIHRLVEQRPVYALHTRMAPSVVEATMDGFELWRAKNSGIGGGEVNGHREVKKNYGSSDVERELRGRLRQTCATGACFVYSTRHYEQQLLLRWAVPQFHDIDALTIMIDPSFNGQFRKEVVAGACVIFQLTDIAKRLSDSISETWQITTD
ncbi:hypothetical protein Tco_0788777 [Tanacetum coccineum]